MSAHAPRVALIHALAHSVAPINDVLARDWPEAQRMNLLDDSLSADLARNGHLDDRMTQRFVALADYAVDTGAQAILFTCSAFGPCIDEVVSRHAGLPVFKPNEAMIEDAVAHGGVVGLLASFELTLQSMPPEFPPGTTVRTALADGALAALNRGDTLKHDQLAAEAARWLAAQGCTVIALAQFSLARARHAVEAATGLPVLTTPDSAVKRLRQRLAQPAA
jgi:aspartate/glutamate racemase